MNARRDSTPLVWWNRRVRKNNRRAPGSSKEQLFVLSKSFTMRHDEKSAAQEDSTHAASQRGDFVRTQQSFGQSPTGRGNRRRQNEPRHGKRPGWKFQKIQVLMLAIWLLKFALLINKIIPAECQSNTVVDAPVITSLVADDPDDLDGTIIALQTYSFCVNKISPIYSRDFRHFVFQVCTQTWTPSRSLLI